MLPIPVVPADALSGLAFSHPINSSKFFAGAAFLETIKLGFVTVRAMGSKLPTAS
jgi:hypothetical protein